MPDPKPPTGYTKTVNKPVKLKEPPKPKMAIPTSAKMKPMGAKTTKPATRKQIAR